MSKIKSATGGIGFLPLLTLLFVSLKLGGVIEWSWYFVISPFIIPLLLAFGIAAPIYATYMYFKENEGSWLVVGAVFVAITWGLNYGLYVLIG